MYFGVEVVGYPETAYLAGHITKEKYLDWYPFKVKNVIMELKDNFLWTYDGAKGAPWMRKDKDYRANSEYKIWRRSVFERDGYTCQQCGQTGGKLEGHHIQKFHTHPKLRYEVSNGVTLCRSCHIKEHRGGGAKSV